jgi:hypothetical protein
MVLTIYITADDALEHILIPNVAEKNILILVEEKKK